MNLRPLTSADIPAALHLSTQAGWNQLAMDWQRLITLWPDACIGGWVKERLVASATLASFGPDVGWIGMVLVDPEMRGCGFGGTIFGAVLERGKAKHLKFLGLDATDLGRPIYEKNGFHVLRGINRWAGHARHPKPSGDLGTSLIAADGPMPAGLIELDRAAVKTDRASLLCHLLREPGVCCRTVRDHGGVVGYGFARRGRVMWAMGPIVARSASAADRVFGALLADIAEQSPGTQVCIDLPAPSVLATALERHGWRIKRELWRMSLPKCAGPLLDSDLVAAAAGFELG